MGYIVMKVPQLEEALNIPLQNILNVLSFIRSIYLNLKCQDIQTHLKQWCHTEVINRCPFSLCKQFDIKHKQNMDMCHFPSAYENKHMSLKINFS